MESPFLRLAQIPPGYALACYKRAVLNPNALTLLERRRFMVGEVTRLAAFHPHPYRIRRGAADMFLDRVAGKAAAERAENCHRGTAAAATELVADHATGHRAADRADTGAMTLLTHRRDGLDYATCRAVGWLRRLLLLLGIVGRRLGLLLLRVLLLLRGRRRRSGRGLRLLRGLLLGSLLLRGLLLCCLLRRRVGRRRRIDHALLVSLRGDLRRLRLIVLRAVAGCLREQARDRRGGDEACDDHRAGSGRDERVNPALLRRLRGLRGGLRVRIVHFGLRLQQESTFGKTKCLVNRFGEGFNL